MVRYSEGGEDDEVAEDGEEGEDLCNCTFCLAYGAKILLNTATLRLKVSSVATAMVFAVKKVPASPHSCVPLQTVRSRATSHVNAFACVVKNAGSNVEEKRPGKLMYS